MARITNFELTQRLNAANTELIELRTKLAERDATIEALRLKQPQAEVRRTPAQLAHELAKLTGRTVVLGRPQ